MNGDHIDLGPEVEGFRAELRRWLATNAPAELRGIVAPRRPTGGLRRALRAWGDRLAGAGYMCVSWPREYGGRGLSSVEVAVMNEEFDRAEVPRVTRGQAESLVGPAIMAHGTPEQKAYFLPRIISGEDVYCQGFSEPGAGSDLASLRTRGVVEDDQIVVTGQKVWTSWYWDATMIFCLCRTSADAPKHQGISYALLPLTVGGEPNGIEFRPLRQMTGESHFAETFLDGARASLFHVVGGLNDGWRVAMTTLGNERGGRATTGHLAFAREFWDLVAEARRQGKAEDPSVRERLAWAYSQVEIMRFSGMQLLAALATGKQPPGASGNGSVGKVRWSEYVRRFGELAMDVVGADALLVGDDYRLAPSQETFLRSRSHTIWGGTAEIQRNIIGERVLGLPKEPRTVPREGA